MSKTCMRLILATLLALVAFAANSILTRSALALDQIGPAAFVAIRLLSGAVMLALLVSIRGGVRGFMRHASIASAASLLLYAAAFSYAYITLDTGIGALILFGGVQITMFAGALIGGEKPGLARWIGTVMGMAGLAVLFAPGAAAPNVIGTTMMAASAVGWGVYSLRGKTTSAPLEATAGNFLLAAPFGILLWVLFPDTEAVSMNGALLGIASGAVASGMGYAIWYSVLPRLDSTLAAILQLTVPLIALAGGALFLGETASWSFAIPALLIIGGVFIALLPPKVAK